jgi:hypothetical protein
MRSLGEHAAIRCLLAALALASGAAGQYWLVLLNPARAGMAWAAAIALFLLLYLLDEQGRELPGREEAVPRVVEWPLALFVIAVGVFFRTFRLTEFPPGLNHDAAWNALYATKILQGAPYTPYVASAWGRESLVMYLQAFSIHFFGMEHVATMMPAVVAMIVMLPLTHLWARDMFGARAALLIAFFLGAAGWPLVYGRIGWGAALQPACTTFTLLYFWRGLSHARVRDFLLSGVGLALTLNTYNAARAVPLVFPLFAIAYLIKHRTPLQTVRRYALGVGAMVLAFAVCIAPLAWYAVTHWVQFMGRAYHLYSSPTQAWDNLKAAALLFNYWGNSDDFFINTPLLELPVAAFFVFGLLWCVLRLRDDRALLLIVGMLVGLLPGLVTRPNANHCVGAMPFTYLFAGLGLLYFVRQAFRVRIAGGALAILLLAITGAAQAGATFNEYLSHDRRRIWGYYPETTVLGRYMRTLVGKYAIWVGGANFPRDTLTYFSHSGDGDPFVRQYVWVDDLSTLLSQPLQPAPGRGLAVILSTIDAAPGVFAQLLRRYPEREVVDLRHPPETGPVFARALLVAPDILPRLAPVEVQQERPRGEVMWTGGQGYDLGRFHTPKGLARGLQGEFYVADTANHRVQKFDAKGGFLSSWGQFGPVAGSFNEPTAIAVDPEGNVHVVDTWNHRIQKLSPDGTPIGMYVPAKGFFGPRGIAISTDRIYVTDGGNNRVVVFDGRGIHSTQFAEMGPGPGQLLQPVGIAVDRDGLIWVVDSGNNRLQAFHRDGTSARIVPVPNWQGDGIKEGYLAATDRGLVLTDPTNDRLLRLQGDHLVAIETPVSLAGPSGIAWDKSSLFVSERGRHAVSRVPFGGS